MKRIKQPFLLMSFSGRLCKKNLSLSLFTHFTPFFFLYIVDMLIRNIIEKYIYRTIKIIMISFFVALLKYSIVYVINYLFVVVVVKSVDLFNSPFTKSSMNLGFGMIRVKEKVSTSIITSSRVTNTPSTRTIRSR